MTGDLHRPPAGGPGRVVLGVGASRGCPEDELAALADATLVEAGLPREAVVAVASADVKADEPAILALAAALGVPGRFFSAEQLAAVDVPSPSAVVASHVGTPSVAEAAALLAAGATGSGGEVGGGTSTTGRLLVTKRRSAHATCAVAATSTSVIPDAVPAGASDPAAGPARPPVHVTPIPTEVPLP